MNSATVSSLQISLPSQASSSVIHSPNGSQEEILSDEEARKRRELLARRPSYRKILNDLSDVEKDLKQERPDSGGGDLGGGGEVPVRPSGPSSGGSSSSVSSSGMMDGGMSGIPTSLASSSDGRGYITGMLPPGLSLGGVNGELSLGGLVPPAAGLVQYNQDQQQPGTSQLLVSVGNDILGLRSVGSPLTVSTSGGMMSQGLGGGGSSMGSYSPSSPTLSQSLRNMEESMGGRGGPLMDGTGMEAVRKRQLRLLKNREAAKECRRKKKEYVKCLENRVAVLENQNKALIEELKTLKELYCRKGE